MLLVWAKGIVQHRSNTIFEVTGKQRGDFYLGPVATI
jgi:hypothetical protein